MRNTQKVKSFVEKWKNRDLPNVELLFDYRNICKNLLYEEEEIIKETIKILKSNIKTWSELKSPVYSTLKNKKFIEKKDLLEKDQWFVKDIRHSNMSTSGSTTGYPFSYLRWEDFLYFIECDNHYDLILEEFNIKKEPNILFFLDIGIKIKEIIEVRNNSNNFMEHHGLNKSNVHYVNFDMFKENREKIFFHLVEHIKNNEIDVMLTNGPNLNSFCNYLKNNKIKIKISKLLSNTNEKLLEGTIKQIEEEKYFDHICDHMRCWDGGATFFTCIEENYHLMDNIAWCVEEEENKLISTDYFSLASPFVNYWNGDFCRIENKFKRCDCGRIYRDFEFLTNRPFTIKGKNINTIRESLSNFNQIKEVRCSKEFLEIVCNSLIKEEDKKTILENINKILNFGEKNERDLIKIKFLMENYG